MVLVHAALKRHQISTSHVVPHVWGGKMYSTKRRICTRESLKKFDGVVDSRVTSIDTAKRLAY